MTDLQMQKAQDMAGNNPVIATIGKYTPPLQHAPDPEEMHTIQVITRDGEVEAVPIKIRDEQEYTDYMFGLD